MAESQLDKLREEQDELLREKKLYTDLLNSDGWKMYVSQAAGHIMANRASEFSDNIKSLDDAFRSCGIRGQIAGMQFAVGLPDAYLNNLEIDLVNSRTAIEEERESDG